jgi:hypothetical protein
MKLQRLLVLAALSLAAACSDDVMAPTVVPETAPAAAAAYNPNPLFNLFFSSMSVGFQSPNENQVPANPAKIVIYSPYAAFATLGPPRVVKVEYTGGAQGWLTGNVEVKSAFQADLNLRVVKGLPLGAYGANVTLTLLGVVNYIVHVNFTSGVYFADFATSGTGWGYGGLWHHSTGNNCVNPRGCTPAVPVHAYFSEATGDFDVPGGTANSGDAMSPAFTLPGTASYPVVELRTWYEIEYDVSPFSYDFMTVVLVDALTLVETELGTINSSPGFVGNGTTFGGGDPFTTFVVPIPPALAGADYHVILRFATGDGAYNDYRGWGVAMVVVREGVAPTAASAARLSGIDPSLVMGEGVGARVGKLSTVERKR